MIISEAIVQKALEAALSTGADFADVFIEDSYSSVLSFNSKRPDEAVVGQMYGAGIRVFFGQEIVYVTTNDLSEAGLVRAALKAAQSRPNGTAQNKILIASPIKYDSIHKFGDMPWETNRESKFQWLNSLDQHARATSSLVTQVFTSLNEKFQKVQIANSLGLHVYDERANSRVVITSYVENNGNKEASSDNEGVMGTLEFIQGVDLKKLAVDTVNRAILLSNSKFAPAGEMPVVMDNGFGGVIFHEACGHLLETTQVQTGSTPFAGKLGQKVAHESVTAIDDGTLVNEWGSLNIDDEGNKTQRTVLIDKGILKSYMADRMGSIKTGHEMTGSGRRQNYKLAPASRMRNTFIDRGTDKFESMIKDVDYGLYAKKMGGGSVGATGDFNFKVEEGYIIRNGQIEEAVKGACLIGKGPEAMQNIIKVSDDLKLATGMCGSVSGTIPAAVGQPQILVSKMIVGGRA